MLSYQAIDYLRGLFILSFSAVTKYFVGGCFSELKTNSKDKNSENSFCPKNFLSPYNKFVSDCCPTKICLERIENTVVHLILIYKIHLNQIK